VLAHGLGQAEGPLPLLLLAAAGAVVATAALLGRRDARDLRGARAGALGAGARPDRCVVLPAVVTTVADHPLTRLALRAAGVGLAALVLAVAAFGSVDGSRNIAPGLVLTGVWGGLVPASLLLGPVWRPVNPLRTLSAGLARLAADRDETATRPLPDRLGWWPAAAGMLAFSWVALVLPGRPVTLLVFLLLYGLAQLGAALVYGQAWFARGEALEAYSTVLGSMAPVTRDAAGRLALANPRTRLADSRPAPGLLGVAAVVIGANLFDAILESDAWHGLALGATQEVVGTAVLAACVLVTYAVAAAVVRRRGLVPALLPAAAGWAAAHHLVPVLLEWRALLPALPPPPPLPVLATASFGLLLAGHVAAVVVGHDRAVAGYGPVAAPGAQLEFRALLIVLLLAAVTLVFGRV